MNALQLLVICAILIAVVLVLFLPFPRWQRKVDTRVDRPPIPVASRDDDQYWYAGFFYSNPNDPELFVPRRFGFGWTLNFGHPRARLFVITLLVMLFVLMLVPPLAVALFGGIVSDATRLDVSHRNGIEELQEESPLILPLSTGSPAEQAGATGRAERSCVPGRGLWSKGRGRQS
ncbi:DUF5808 domain-containing protein [Dictyobacter kobayashii]|uniref:DUF5808 domain-containing protein n=1 Tax=Dictyobacter kobayashii TaxID=2014872 RepID=A0A402ANZ4_9CHLR|nr:DUF5808 domain-containing protein [Dictyobacter kobayashii]GCE20812.1 hypothetical protein KDK_46120 [Dictyobacter kobayashii]